MYCSGAAKPSNLVCERDKNGMTILHHATVHDRYAVTRYLVDSFSRVLLHVQNNYGQRALHFACAKGTFSFY